jgi:hypothetical protein
MTTTKQYEGGCHCGAVRYRVTTDLGRVTACNCSMCGRAGTLLNFVPEEAFELLSGEESLSDYQFAKQRIHHLFCKTCGIKSFARGMGPGGKMMCAVNVRCLDGVEPDSLTISHFDGRNL